MNNYFLLAFLVIFVLMPFQIVFGQQPITFSGENFSDKIIFDGKWSHDFEWKLSSLVESKYDEKHLRLRLGHDYDNILLFVDVGTDLTPSKNMDRVIICLDSKNNGGLYLQKDDFCLIKTLGSKNFKLYQGGGDFNIRKNLVEIKNYTGIIVKSAISDSTDRYSSESRPNYEVKIPVELIGRSDSYGFYVGAYDSTSGNLYSWPKLNAEIFYPFIPSPDDWATIYSPDKSLPEFNFVIVTFVIVIIISMILIRFQKIPIKTP